MQNTKLKLTVPWESLELAAQQQIQRVLAIPELERLAIMPDVHAGNDLCIGGVALLNGLVAPSFVGTDIGCGMCHANTGLGMEELGLSSRKDRERLFKHLQKAIPCDKHDAPCGQGLFPEFKSSSGDTKLTTLVQNASQIQFATLGHGNHFLEIGVNSGGTVGITIHSGSRHPGFAIAEWYLPHGRLFVLESELGQAYLTDMQWAMDYARLNRRAMMETALRAARVPESIASNALQSDAFIDASHNHALPFGAHGMLHRKGASPANMGQPGIIPANQRDGVWITCGLGNAEYLCSASHGAGRSLPRKAAARKGTTRDMEKLMQGIVCRIDKEVLDEAPWAYKKIDGVLAAQQGLLIDIIDHFKPVLVMKG